MVEHIKRWKLRKLLEREHNVYVRSFLGAKVMRMKNCVKPCIIENDSKNAILPVPRNKPTSEFSSKKIAKSVPDVTENL